MDMETAILANGAPPTHPVPLAHLREANELICCDGACRAAHVLGREPDFVVGDGDSLAAADRSALGARFVHMAEQETNDLAKAFRFACSRATRIAILGATGLREDHTLGNIFRLIDFTAVVPDTVLYTDTGTFEAVRGERTFAAQPEEAVSIFAPVPGTEVASKGLQWPLDGVSLADLWSGTLNRTTGPSFTLRTNGRPILVYRPYAMPAASVPPVAS